MIFNDESLFVSVDISFVCKLLWRVMGKSVYFAFVDYRQTIKYSLKIEGKKIATKKKSIYKNVDLSQLQLIKLAGVGSYRIQKNHTEGGSVYLAQPLLRVTECLIYTRKIRAN